MCEASWPAPLGSSSGSSPVRSRAASPTASATQRGHRHRRPRATASSSVHSSRGGRRPPTSPTSMPAVEAVEPSLVVASRLGPEDPPRRARRSGRRGGVEAARPSRRRRSARRSSASAASAAPRRASRRSAIGVVPAWSGWPAKCGQHPVDAGDARHDADRDAGGLEHRPLLDVQLDEGSAPASGARRPPRARRARRPPEPAPRRGCLRPGPARPRWSRLEVAGDRAAAHAAQAEVVRLLAEEVDDEEVVSEVDAVVWRRQPHRLDGAEHADDAVEATAALDGVGVRARHDARPASPAAPRQGADEVAGGVGLDGEAGVGHPWPPPRLATPARRS